LNFQIALLTVAGCFRQPSPPACTLPSLSFLLAPYTMSEFLLLGDLNWDMLKPPDQVLKQWDSLNLSQMITNPTRYDSKHPEKATLLDAIRKAKVSYFKEQFWKTVKDLENKLSSSQLPMSLNVDDVVVTDKELMAELYNHHFIKTGFLFYSSMPHCPSNISSSPTPSKATTLDAPPTFSPAQAGE
ncbi:unnamed protein product, partial [Coregonus sp. 'balchen']